MSTQNYGTVKEGVTHLYHLENEYLSAAITDYGAALVSLIDKNTGIDILLGFPDAHGYERNSGLYMGAIVGRVANRIANAEFELEGKTYTLDKNNGPNCNHSGYHGWNEQIFHAREYAEDHLVLELEDLANRFPGNLQVQVSYTLKENSLAITISGISDADTLFATTSHCYFNLNGKGNILSHRLTIPAREVGLIDENSLAVSTFEVKNTVFDFQSGKIIGQDMDGTNPQIAWAKGYDHAFLVEGDGMRNLCTLQGDRLQLDVISDQPCLQVYTAGWLTPCLGKYGFRYEPYSGVALEAEYFPDAIHHPEMKQPLLLKKQHVSQHIQLQISAHN